MKTAAETARQRWERETLAPALDKAPERARTFSTISGHPINRVYTVDDLAGIDYARDIGDPGQCPYTRGIHASGYQGKLWTMRQFAGFGTPEETNARYKALLAAGGTGLSVAFDLPTLMGRDPDHALSLGEVGKCGVSIASLADMETLFEEIDLRSVTTSMTINSPAAMIFAMYLVVAERQGETAGHGYLAEVELLTVHGILHLLGYDHAEPEEHREMFGLQDELLGAWRARTPAT